MWFCYLLISINPRYIGHSYVGISTDPQRRLHEHNYLKKGAAHTHAKRPWKIAAIVSGFLTKGDAQKYEIRTQTWWRFKSAKGEEAKVRLFMEVDMSDKIDYSKNLVYQKVDN